MDRRYRNGLIIGACVLFLLIVVSCLPERREALPQGEQTITGILKAVELSRTRRGTHVLLQDGDPVYYVESSNLQLKQYEGLPVTLRGSLEHNTERAALPVLVVEALATGEGKTKLWKVPSLRLALRSPEEWIGRTSGSGIVFTVNDRDDPILIITAATGSLAPDGTPLIVAGERARRSIDLASGRQTVQVERQGRVIHFTLAPPDDPLTAPYLAQQFVMLLKSVTFDGASSSRRTGTGTVRSGTGAVRDEPCGGAAGFLCPPGQYCEVTDTANGIGICKPIR